AASDKDAGPVNPQEVAIPDAEAGVKGPVFDSDDYQHDPGADNPDPNAPFDAPPGAKGGTSIGMHGPGHFGNGASPWVSRQLGGGGHGKNGHGDGLNAGAFGGDPKKNPDTAVFAALQWLKNHQSPDGRWDGASFDAQCKMNRCDG